MKVKIKNCSKQIKDLKYPILIQANYSMAAGGHTKNDPPVILFKNSSNGLAIQLNNGHNWGGITLTDTNQYTILPKGSKVILTQE